MSMSQRTRRGHMKPINKLEELRRVEWGSLIILIIAAGFIAFDSMIVGIIIMVIGIFIEWKFYRCPHCNESLDTRMKLNEHTYCPKCGEIICKEK